jgi:hypothetical protein
VRRRGLFNLVTALSLLLFAAQWVRSRVIRDILWYEKLLEAERPPGPAVPPVSQPDLAGQSEDGQTATKPWVMPSPEELAVKAAVIEFQVTEPDPVCSDHGAGGIGGIGEALVKAEAHRAAQNRTVFLTMPREEEAALLAMLAGRVPQLKESAKMRIDKDSGEASDAETGRPALAITVTVVRMWDSPTQQGQQATARAGGTPRYYKEFGLSNASGRWVVVTKYMGAVP